MPDKFDQLEQQLKTEYRRRLQDTESRQQIDIARSVRHRIESSRIEIRDESKHNISSRRRLSRKRRVVVWAIASSAAVLLIVSSGVNWSRSTDTDRTVALHSVSSESTKTRSSTLSSAPVKTPALSEKGSRKGSGESDALARSLTVAANRIPKTELVNFAIVEGMKGLHKPHDSVRQLFDRLTEQDLVKKPTSRLMMADNRGASGSSEIQIAMPAQDHLLAGLANQILGRQILP